MPRWPGQAASRWLVRGLAITIAGVAALVAIAYLRSREDNPGLTTEIALIVTALLGGLSMQQPALAAGTAAALAVLLAVQAQAPRHEIDRPGFFRPRD